MILKVAWIISFLMILICLYFITTMDLVYDRDHAIENCPVTLRSGSIFYCKKNNDDLIVCGLGEPTK